MSDKSESINPQFMQLIFTFHSAAMQFMGKVVSPISGKIERNLIAAQSYIDILSMIEEKTKGNLTEDEGKLLGRILYELRMNYIDESKKGETSESSTADTEKASDNSSDNAPE